MNETVRIARHEMITAFRRPSFLLVAFGIPLLMLLIVGGLALVKRGSAGAAAGSGGPRFEPEVEGYVDHSGLIDVIPASVPAGHLQAYTNEEQARQALDTGQIAAYYVIPADYVETGELFYVYPDSKSLTSDGQEWLMLRALLTNLVGGDDELAQWVWDPIDLEVTNLAPEPVRGADQSTRLLRLLPAVMVILLFATLMINSNLLAESVSSEKANRTIEVLMLSVTPRQMLAGKIVGLGIAALLQTIAWLGAVYIVLTAGGPALNLPRGFTFPAFLLVWGLVFFLLGFAIYASLMAGVGACASKLKEASQASFIVLSPLMAGYLVGLIAPLTEASREALPVALSLFPLTAPVVMVMRLVEGSVPAWQLLLSVGLMVATAYLIVRAVAAIFRAQYLLSGQSFSLPRFFGALLGR